MFVFCFILFLHNIFIAMMIIPYADPGHNDSQTEDFDADEVEAFHPGNHGNLLIVTHGRKPVYVTCVIRRYVCRRQLTFFFYMIIMIIM